MPRGPAVTATEDPAETERARWSELAQRERAAVRVERMANTSITDRFAATKWCDACKRTVGRGKRHEPSCPARDIAKPKAKPLEPETEPQPEPEASLQAHPNVYVRPPGAAFAIAETSAPEPVEVPAPGAHGSGLFLSPAVTPTEDPGAAELMAMLTMRRAIEPLDPEQRRRALVWLIDACGIDLTFRLMSAG